MVLRDRLRYFVRIGMSTVVVCLPGIDDFDVDGRWNALYNDETLVMISSADVSK